MKNQHNHRYALDENGLLIDVFSLSDKNRGQSTPFFCCSCGSRMGTRMGSKNTWHFYHISNTTNCSYEGYLHYVAKEIFASTYKQCIQEGIPFGLLLPVEKKCIKYSKLIDGAICVSDDLELFDISKVFDTVDIEKPHDGFVPDILLSSSYSKDVVFVEIAVTHKCDSKKIESGSRIIELNISSEGELFGLKKHEIDTSDPAVSIYNFQKKTIETECEIECSRDVSIFTVNKSNICGRDNIKMSNLEDITKRRDLQCLIIDSEIYEGMMNYENNIFNAYKQGIEISNCNLCRHVSGRGSGLLHCNILNKRAFENDALRCKEYEVDSELISSIEPSKSIYIYSDKAKENETGVFKNEQAQQHKEVVKSEEERLIRPVLPFFEE
ncbi:hypothetical protein FM071_10385 (plasmid) [Sulfurimonas paralvinellae]|uniref:Competence protein CoiA-like N-terminal domain-containing protein n=1 Tax=Sulfurimonas paralvinellae TaxID=317658 RepID=A0A7M1BAP6_9BACT|nr:hypothetical protein FM071_10385 [Sulfurimonas paralvinellae]